MSEQSIQFIPISNCILPISKINWNKNNEIYKYIDLSSVDRQTHSITSTTEISKDNAPSRAQQIIREGDVLFGTTRPLLRRYCSVTTEYDGQICSSGFAVLRANTDIIYGKWIELFISTDDFYTFIEKHQIEGSYPSVTTKDVLKYKIPVPDKPTQERIIRILNRFSNLTAELTAELTARKQQYEFYRDKLLSFDHLTPEERERAGITMMRISEFADIIRGNGLQKRISQSQE